MIELVRATVPIGRSLAARPDCCAIFPVSANQCTIVATLEQRGGVLVLAEPTGGSSFQSSSPRVAVWGISMPAVRLHAASLAEAAELVALVWRVLEGNNVATPKLFVIERDGITTIELLFASLTHANLIAETVPGVSPVREAAT